MSDRSTKEEPLREVVELNGEWIFVTDPNKVGTEAQWHQPGVGFPTRSHTVTVPHTWQSKPEYRDYTGTAWYRRTVKLRRTKQEGHELILRFGAVDYEATVWVNGQQVGEHSGGYLPFELDVTEPFELGENLVVVRVTDPEDLTEIPHGKQGEPWYSRVSGMWQSIELISRPRVHVQSIQATPDVGTETATINVILAGTVNDHCCTVRAMRDGVVTATTTGKVDNSGLQLSFDNPVHWSPANPELYDLEVDLLEDGKIIDRYEDYFGFRDFDHKNGRFILNGDQIEIRGILEQGYYPDTLYRPPSADTFHHEVAAAKELGFNLLRKHLKPAHPDFLEAADRQGLLVWAEPANPDRYTKRSRTAVLSQLREMIERDYNSPSIVIWSLYNEEWGIGHYDGEEALWTDTDKQDFLAESYKQIHEWDPTRLVCDNSGWAHVMTDVNDFHRYFASPDHANKWKMDLEHIARFPDDNYATTNLKDADVPIMVSEFGTWGLSGMDTLQATHSGDPEWFDHEFLTDSLKRPAGVEERFEAIGLNNVFGEFANLESTWQHREFISLKHLIGAMRAHERIAGYVLTQLSDVEWEFNGALDHERTEKHFSNTLAAVNAPIALIAELQSHVVNANEAVHVDSVVVNDTGDSLGGDVEWSLSGRHGHTGVRVDPHSIGRTGTVKIPLSSISDVEAPVNTVELSMSLETPNGVITTVEPITVVNRERDGSLPDKVYATGQFASRLARRDVTVTHELRSNVDCAVVDTITSDVMEYVKSGGKAIQVPKLDGRMDGSGPFEYRSVPEAESWRGVASLYYQDTPLLTDVCTGASLSWEFEGIYPSIVASELDPEADNIHVGYIEGWLANWGSPLVTRMIGDGALTAATFRIAESYGHHPVASLLCDRLLCWLSS